MPSGAGKAFVTEAEVATESWHEWVVYGFAFVMLAVLLIAVLVIMG